MYFLEDGVTRCGFYECQSCSYRFLHKMIVPKMVCPYCGEPGDMEVGPNETMPEPGEDAVLLQVIEGAENVEQYDQLLSLALTGGDYEWI